MPTVTDQYIAERIDPFLAVDRALTAAEREVFLADVLVGQFQGAQPADWIAEADNSDAYLPQIESWWFHYGDKNMAYFRTMFELPEALLRRIITASLYAMIAVTASSKPGLHRRTHVEIAAGAALWARGYAEALDWTPTYPQDQEEAAR